MNNKELFIDGFLDRISREFLQVSDPKKNKDLAFEIFSISAVLDKPFQEVFDNVIIKDKSGKRSGSKDGGIDGIYFRDLGDYYEMLVFQCKNVPGLKDNEINKFRNDVREIFSEGNRIGKKNIEDLEAFINEYKSISLSGKYIEIKCYFIYNGNNIDKDYGNNEPTYNLYHNPAIDYYIYDSNWVYDKVRSVAKPHRKTIEFTFKPQNSNFSLLDHQALYTFSISNTRAANFRVLALDICELMQKEININGSFDTLFEENIRQYLGTSKFRANREMNKTLNSENSVLFPFLNNGITIIAEKITVPKSAQDGQYYLPVVNPQIVNGLQTSRVLYDLYKIDPSKLKEVYVNIRVYETTEPSLVEKITDATNTQTPITYKDKISNKDFKEFAKTVFFNKGIVYITKRGEGFNSSSQKNIRNQIDSETVLKFWYATFYEEPETAKNSIARVLQDIYDAATSENNPLKILFDGNIDSPIYKQFIAVYQIYHLIQICKHKMVEDNKTYLMRYEHLLS
ncbi:MAG: AIPR family protein [Ignavibacteriae bacterium]|nr:AIPR family protein [Ignavibacteriota bacterium]